MKGAAPISFVRTSANWDVEICFTKSDLFRTLFYTKLKSTPICLVLGWNTGLAARDREPKLSHHRVGGFVWKPSSPSKD